MLLDTDSKPGLIPIPLHLEYGTTIESSLAKTIAEAKRRQENGKIPIRVPAYPPGFSDAIAPLVSIVLYLCSEGPDLATRGIRRTPSRPKPQKIKGGWRLFPPDAPTIWDVGADIGAALRMAAREEGRDLGRTHASPRPHIRRAHWHLYWKGSKKNNEQRPVLKWLHPMTVGLRQEATSDLRRSE